MSSELTLRNFPNWIETSQINTKCKISAEKNIFSTNAASPTTNSACIFLSYSAVSVTQLMEEDKRFCKTLKSPKDGITSKSQQNFIWRHIQLQSIFVCVSTSKNIFTVLTTVSLRLCTHGGKHRSARCHGNRGVIYDVKSKVCCCADLSVLLTNQIATMHES